MPTELKQQNLLCAGAIHLGVDILLNPNTTEEQKAEVRTKLATIFKDVMPLLRGEERAQHIIPVAESVVTLHSSIKGSPCEALLGKVSEYISLDETALYFICLPALCEAISNEISSCEVAEKSPMFKPLNDVANTICRGEALASIPKQLYFIQDILHTVPPLTYIGDEACGELTDSIMSLGGSFAFSRSFTEDFVYSLFHKSRLSSLIKFYTESASKKSAYTLQELLSEYGSDNTDRFVDDPFYRNKRERDVFVKGLQKYTLETLILTKNFLEEQGLRFYLTEGTLLGAARHGGFIPWDDDVDIAMPREDYDRLVELAKQGKIPPELNFDALENNPNHWVLGAKMQLVRKTPYIQHKVTRLSKCNGPYVDIFPIDYWNRPAGIKFSIANMWVKVCRRLLFVKTGYSVKARNFSYLIIARVITPLLKNTWIEKLAIKNMKKFQNGNRKYSVNLCSYYPYYKEVFPTSFFGEPLYINFEGEQMPVPQEYDYMLKTIYGKNYDSIPPVRVTNMRKHAFELNKEVK